MLIEKNLPDNYFRNDNHKSLANIYLTSCFISEKTKHFLEKEDLTPQQYNILRILRQSNIALSTLRIREMMIDKMSDTSRIVERLVKKDLVHKQTSRHDKRLVDVSLSGKGIQLVDRLENRTNEVDSLLDHLTKEDLAQLNHLLNKIRDQQ